MPAENMFLATILSRDLLYANKEKAESKNRKIVEVKSRQAIFHPSYALSQPSLYIKADESGQK